MRLPSNMRARLAEQFLIAARRMQEERNPLRKLYYFSVLFGESMRILNLTWDTDLALIYQVTRLAHQEINTRIQLTLGGDQVIPLNPEIISELETVTLELAELVNHKEPDDLRLKNIVGRIAELAYASTGNGAFLVEQGKIRLSRVG